MIFKIPFILLILLPYFLFMCLITIIIYLIILSFLMITWIIQDDNLIYQINDVIIQLWELPFVEAFDFYVGIFNDRKRFNKFG